METWRGAWGVAAGHDAPIAERATILDPIHGAVKVSDAEFTLLQTPFLRRLHGIKQLGFLYLVYPQATHSRLSHSLGVMHLAGRMAAQVAAKAVREGLDGFIAVDPEGLLRFIQLARLAGLLHDLGHLPYSHVLEIVIEDLYAAMGKDGQPPMPSLSEGAYTVVRDGMKRLDQYLEGWEARPHEVFTRMLIDLLAQRLEESRLEETASLAKIAGEALVPRGEGAGSVSALLEEVGLTHHVLELVSTLISNDVADADRLDYLVRDSHNTGVVFGTIDYDRIIENLSLKVDGEQVCILVSEKALPTLEDVFDARFKMYRSVYLHHKSVAVQVAVKRVTLALVDPEIWDRVAPPSYRDCGGSGLLFDFSRMAECIAEGRILFDDSEFDVMTRGLATCRDCSGPGRRWALSLLDRRELLPVSLVKRPEAALLRLRKVLAGRGARNPDSVLLLLRDYSMVVGIREAVRSLVAREAGVAKDLVEVEYRPQTIVKPVKPHTASPAKGLCLEGGALEQSLYLSMVAAAASYPLPLIYAFSDDESAHKRIHRVRETLRAKIIDVISDVILDGIRRARA